MTDPDRSLLVFRLGRLQLAVPALDSAGILMAPARITHAPGGRPDQGLFHHSDQVVALTDMRARLGLPAPSGSGRVILTHAAGSGLHGVLVDEVTGIVQQGETHSAPLPPELPRRLFPEALLYRDNLVLVTGFAALLTLESVHDALRQLAAPETEPNTQEAEPQPAPASQPTPPPATRPHMPLDQALRAAADHQRATPAKPQTPEPAPRPPSRTPIPDRPRTPPPTRTAAPPSREPGTQTPAMPPHLEARPAPAPAPLPSKPAPSPRGPYEQPSANGFPWMATLILAVVATTGALLWWWLPPQMTASPPIASAPAPSEEIAPPAPVAVPPPSIAAPPTPVATIAPPPEEATPTPKASVETPPPRIAINRAPHRVDLVVEQAALPTPAQAVQSTKAPEEARPDSPPPSKEERIVIHTVVHGDTLWDIAQHYIEDPWAYRELARQSDIRNPDLIYPGDQVRIIFRPAR